MDYVTGAVNAGYASADQFARDVYKFGHRWCFDRAPTAIQVLKLTRLFLNFDMKVSKATEEMLEEAITGANHLIDYVSWPSGLQRLFKLVSDWNSLVVSRKSWGEVSRWDCWAIIVDLVDLGLAGLSACKQPAKFEKDLYNFVFFSILGGESSCIGLRRLFAVGNDGKYRNDSAAHIDSFIRWLDNTLVQWQAEFDDLKLASDAMKTIIPYREAFEATHQRLQRRVDGVETAIVQLGASNKALEGTQTQLEAKSKALEGAKTQLEASNTVLENTGAQLEAKDKALEGVQTRLEVSDQALRETLSQLEASDKVLKAAQGELVSNMSVFEDNIKQWEVFSAHLRTVLERYSRLCATNWNLTKDTRDLLERARPFLQTVHENELAKSTGLTGGTEYKASARKKSEDAAGMVAVIDSLLNRPHFKNLRPADCLRALTEGGVLLTEDGDRLQFTDRKVQSNGVILIEDGYLPTAIDGVLAGLDGISLKVVGENFYYLVNCNDRIAIDKHASAGSKVGGLVIGLDGAIDEVSKEGPGLTFRLIENDIEINFDGKTLVFRRIFSLNKSPWIAENKQVDHSEGTWDDLVFTHAKTKVAVTKTTKKDGKVTFTTEGGRELSFPKGICKFSDDLEIKISVDQVFEQTDQPLTTPQVDGGGPASPPTEKRLAVSIGPETTGVTPKEMKNWQVMLNRKGDATATVTKKGGVTSLTIRCRGVEIKYLEVTQGMGGPSLQLINSVRTPLVGRMEEQGGGGAAEAVLPVDNGKKPTGLAADTLIVEMERNSGGLISKSKAAIQGGRALLAQETATGETPIQTSTASIEHVIAANKLALETLAPSGGGASGASSQDTATDEAPIQTSTASIKQAIAANKLALETLAPSGEGASGASSQDTATGEVPIQTSTASIKRVIAANKLALETLALPGGGASGASSSETVDDAGFVQQNQSLADLGQSYSADRAERIERKVTNLENALKEIKAIKPSLEWVNECYNWSLLSLTLFKVAALARMYFGYNSGLPWFAGLEIVSVLLSWSAWFYTTKMKKPEIEKKLRDINSLPTMPQPAPATG